MNETENFENLQQLLKLKRYEVPPPGYFNNFSTQVINRLEAEARSNQASSPRSWYRKFLQLLETNPVAAGIFGMSICGLLISGITYSQRRDAVEFSSNPGSNGGIDLADASSSVKTSSRWNKGVDAVVASTDPVLSTNIPSGIFNAFGGLGVQQVSFAASH